MMKDLLHERALALAGLYLSLTVGFSQRDNTAKLLEKYQRISMQIPKVRWRISRSEKVGQKQFVRLPVQQNCS